MKTPSDEYAGKEEAKIRKPIELFHFYDDLTLDQRFCSSDIAISYGGNTYEPATVTRGPIEYNAELEISKMVVTTDYLNPAVSQFIAQSPTQQTWVQVLKLFSDQTPYEVDVIFVGQISTITLSGTKAEATVVGFEVYLNRPACILRYQNQCNHNLFDEGCGLLEDDYGIAKSISSVSSDGLTIDFVSLTEADSYFTLGFIRVGSGATVDYRMIVSNIGDSISVRYKFNTSPSGTVYLYPGCDGDLSTCTDKFSNEDNFLGFPYIPEINPTRVRVWQ
ncbi:MAG: hypothetical protein DRQ42_00175 [Gammaproteobacteria bacterium]|nr:MAG: hypothetical protein DRQ42_00175 [Gammaproteobacteria bacterium]